MEVEGNTPFQYFGGLDRYSYCIRQLDVNSSSDIYVITHTDVTRENT